MLRPSNSSTPGEDSAASSTLGETEDGEDKEEKGEEAKEGNAQINAGSLVGRDDDEVRFEVKIRKIQQDHLHHHDFHCRNSSMNL